jgi:predicted TIM-barrel fold metal-dependent hydrolase
MRIINTHTHIIDSKEIFAKENLHYLEYLKEIPTFSDVDKVTQMLSVENLLAQMDEAGIEKSVLFAVDAPLLTASNEFVANICKNHPERFIAFASVNPNRKEALHKIKNAILQHGMKGMKFHPPLQDFYPNESRLWPIYKLASDMGIPIAFHVGSTPFGNFVKLKQADPLLIDDVANEFPHLKIILTHLGTLWHNESFMIAEKHPNIYIDTAAYPYEIEELLTEKLIMRVGSEKFLFGTDFPMPYEGGMHRMIDFVKCIRQLAISNELKEMIFYRNFETLMNEHV